MNISNETRVGKMAKERKFLTITSQYLSCDLRYCWPLTSSMSADFSDIFAEIIAHKPALYNIRNGEFSDAIIMSKTVENRPVKLLLYCFCLLHNADARATY